MEGKLFDQDEEYKIYILLTYSGSLLSRLIHIYTGEPYSHVSLALDTRFDELYSFGRKKPNNPLYAGFVKEDIENGTYARFPKTNCALYSLRIRDSEYRKLRREMNRFKYNRDKYKYNLLGLLGVILEKPIEREYNYFCSQFVSELLKNSGIEIIDKPSGLTAPSDFRLCEKLHLEYEGNLQELYRENLTEAL